MANKKEEVKIVLERTYIVPIRRSWIKAPRHRRAKKGVTGLKEFLLRHMKPKDANSIKIGKYLNEDIWKHGIKNPPSRVKIITTKDDKGNVFAELEGAPVEIKELKQEKSKKTEKKEAPQTKEEKKAKKFEQKEEAIKELNAEISQEIQKEEIKELKQESHENKKESQTPKPKEKHDRVEPHQQTPKHV